jgi:ring-1,2-phenylacetyl-CoA epoxidase subunit PaaE
MDQLQLKIIRIIPETKNASTFVIERSDGHPLHYEAGQFLTLIVTPKETQLRRSYSFSSTPLFDDFISITIKRIANGEASRWLLDHLGSGDNVVSLPASGKFTVETNIEQSRQFFFIVAGSGITPAFSLIKKILIKEPHSEVFLFYQNRDEDNIIFEAQLLILQNDHPLKFKWVNFLSRPRNRFWQAERLNNPSLEKWIRAYWNIEKKQACFLCGPTSFMRMAQFTLKEMGVTDDSIRKEYFTVDFIPPPPFIVNPGFREIMILRNNLVFRLRAAYPTNILQAALDNHIQLPYSCRGGRCSTCVARLIKGKVKMSINEVLTEQEVKEGWVLTCVGYPETDIELSF